MEFKRTQRQHFLIILTFLMISWLWHDFVTPDAMMEKVLGVLCGACAAVIACRYQGDVKDRYIGCSRKSLTPDAIDAIVLAVQVTRSNLPTNHIEAETGATT